MFLRNQLVSYRKLTKILDKKPKVLENKCHQIRKLKRKRGPKENKENYMTIGNYKVILIMALKITTLGHSASGSNVAINDLFLAALLLISFRRSNITVLIEENRKRR